MTEQTSVELIAVDLYHREVMTLGQAAKLVGMALGDFIDIDLCGELRVPILWEPAEGIGQEVDAFAAAMNDAPASA